MQRRVGAGRSGLVEIPENMAADGALMFPTWPKPGPSRGQLAPMLPNFAANKDTVTGIDTLRECTQNEHLLAWELLWIGCSYKNS